MRPSCPVALIHADSEVEELPLCTDPYAHRPPSRSVQTVTIVTFSMGPNPDLWEFRHPQAHRRALARMTGFGQFAARPAAVFALSQNSGDCTIPCSLAPVSANFTNLRTPRILGIPTISIRIGRGNSVLVGPVFVAGHADESGAGIPLDVADFSSGAFWRANEDM